MAKKYESISELYNSYTRLVVSSPRNWKSFLASACRNYRLRFDEQLLVYAQRPDAEAVLDIRKWNSRFGRWVNRGASGIAVFSDVPGEEQRLVYYFDISDTHPGERARPVPLWQMKAEYGKPVTEALENSFGSLKQKKSVEEAVISAAENLTEEHLPFYLADLYACRQGTLLEELDEETLSGICRSLVSGSIAFMMLRRLDFDAASLLSRNVFYSIPAFSTPDALTALGTVVSGLAEKGLNEISRAVFALEQENRKSVLQSREGERKEELPPAKAGEERSMENEYQPKASGNSGGSRKGGDLVPHAGGLASARPENAGAAEAAAGTVRRDAEKIPEGKPPDSLQQIADTGEAERPSARDRTESPENGGGADPENGSGGADHRGAEGSRHDELGAEDEQHPKPGRGDRAEGGDFRLVPDAGEQNLLPDDGQSLPETEEQLTWDAGTAKAKNPVSPVPQPDFSAGQIDAVLCQGSGVSGGKMRIYQQFQKSLSASENIGFLKEEYGWGGRFPVLAGAGIGEQHDGTGITLSGGTGPGRTEKHLSWKEVEKRIAALIRSGRYLTREEMQSYPEWLREREDRRKEQEEQAAFSFAEPDGQREASEVKERIPEHRQPPVRSEAAVMPESPKPAETGDLLHLPERKESADGTESEESAAFPESAEPAEEQAINPEPEITGESSGPVPFIDHYYVAEDLRKRGALEPAVYDTFDEALKAYRELPGDRVKALGVYKTPNPVPGCFDFIQCIDGRDRLTADYQGTADWQNPEIEELTGRIREYLKLQQAEQTAPAGEEEKPETEAAVLSPEIPAADRVNFKLAEHPVEEVPKKERFRRNLAAVRLLKRCEEENRSAAPEEQLVLSKYVGWGGIPEAFDLTGKSWREEAEELRNLLEPAEYQAARESSLTAFYTPPAVIAGIWEVLQRAGLESGNILEPSCGTGHFIGMLPASMAGSRVYGVELDSISGRIAQKLYPEADIQVESFEKAVLPDSFFDCVTGNVPFGQFQTADRRYDRYHFLIHDYFLAKSLDKLRPGGVLACITSRGTMDKENPAARRYLAERAELLGAVRLPNDVFQKNAGTEVVSDILFLRKRDRLVREEPDWVQTVEDGGGRRMNRYFSAHPEMVLGEWTRISGRFGEEDTVLPYPDRELSDLLTEALSEISFQFSPPEEREEAEEELSIPADPAVRNFSYTLTGGQLYYRENSRMLPVKISEADRKNRREERICGMIEVREAVRELIALQTEDCSDEAIRAAQERLNTVYDRFSAGYGLLNDSANLKAFSDDSSCSLLSALEIIGEEGRLERKADIFFRRTIRPHIPVTRADTAGEALALSIAEKASVDMDYICRLTGKSEEQICQDLKGVIFRNPLYREDGEAGAEDTGSPAEPKYLTADAWLSGNVREKLKAAEQAAARDPEHFASSLEALRQVQPKDLTAAEISVRLGAVWIAPQIVEQFIFEFLETPRYLQWNMRVHFFPLNGEWYLEGKSGDSGNIRAYSTYGTSRINAYKIIEETLNLRDVRIFDYVEDGEGKRKAVLNKNETALAQAKQELIRQGFQDWIWSDHERREKLCRLYNDKFNAVRPREFDGSHIAFAGMNPEIELRQHQKNAVARILYGGNTLLAHCVGAGKTYEMAAAAMESKRLGLCTKSLFVVPNHLTEQWAAEFLQLYPAANILVAAKKDFETQNRRRFCGRIATGDYDAVIIGHSQFEKIPMSLARQRKILEQQLEEVVSGIADLRHSRGDHFSMKQLEKTKKSLKVRLEKLNDQSSKDDVVTFEELGIDRLFVDESHFYKNLFLYTKMRNVGGLAQTEARKSSDLFMKCRYLDELTGGRGTVFATGTPISNSMAELYTIQRYLQYGVLEKYGLQYFDSWASTFGETVTAVELTPAGTGYRARTRFSRFYNLPELMSIFRETADIQTADMLKLPVPEVHYHTIAVKPSPDQQELVASLSERADRVKNGMVSASQDNMLLITNDGRKLALDQRLLHEALPDFAGSKLNACVDNVVRIWRETAERSSAQLIFCDLSTPKNDGSFSVYNDIRQKLLSRGIPAKEVKFIHEADTEAKKQALFKQVRKGEVRVLLGSTFKMGAGTNCQDKLIALHDLDCPWRPSDLEQRSGRIVRQGNENKEVDIYRYVTEETFDAYLYQLIEGKQRFASQIMTSKSPVRSAEDIDEAALSYAEIKMLATGNPFIREKMDLDIQVQRLRLLKAASLNEKYALEDKVIRFYPAEIALQKDKIAGLEQDIACVREHAVQETGVFAGMRIGDAFFAEKADAGEALLDACARMTGPDPVPLGEYRGFSMELQFDLLCREYQIILKGALSHTVPLGQSAAGNLIRMDNVLNGLEERLEKLKTDLENTGKQFAAAQDDIKKPFPQEEELTRKLARLQELNVLLDADRAPPEIPDAEPDERERKGPAEKERER